MKLGNGQSTVFWQDVWHKDDSMAERFPALYSHCKLQNLSVQAVVSGRLRRHLVPRLTTTAAAEKAELETIPGTILLSDCDDQRECPFAQPGGKLGTSGLYKLIKTSRCPDMQAGRGFWQSCAPARVQFFAWLLMHGRLQCRANLHKKTIVDNATCELCNGAPEKAEHLLFSCPFSASFWGHLGFRIGSETPGTELLQVTRPQNVPAKHFDTFMLLCCWQLWKRRNGVVFRQEMLTQPQLLLQCKQDEEELELSSTERRR